MLAMYTGPVFASAFLNAFRPVLQPYVQPLANVDLRIIISNDGKLPPWLSKDTTIAPQRDNLPAPSKDVLYHQTKIPGSICIVPIHAGRLQ
jgi:hypothetical protein